MTDEELQQKKAEVTVADDAPDATVYDETQSKLRIGVNDDPARSDQNFGELLDSLARDPALPKRHPIDPFDSRPVDPTMPKGNPVYPSDSPPSSTDRPELASSQTPDGYQAIDVIAKDGDGAKLLKDLQGLGLKGGGSFGAMASGYMPVTAMKAVESMDNVVSTAPAVSSTHAGKVTNQADRALMTDTYRASTGFDGTGIKVGILSDSFNTNANAVDPKIGTRDDAAADMASNDLPSATKILSDSANGTDEGRGMAQIIHDIAPGCAIDFSTANGGQAVMAQHILDLANDGCKVIVDDVTYLNELMYQDGPIAQAISQVKAMGVSYYSSASNDGKNGYEAPFNMGTSQVSFTYNNVSYVANQFAPGVTRIPIVLGSSEDILLQWAEPGISAGGKGAQSDLDLFITDANGNVLKGSSGKVFVSTSNNINRDPTEIVSLTGGAGQTVYVQVGLKSGTAPSDLKLIVSDNGSGASIPTVANNTNTGTSFGHNIAAGAVSVGAAFYGQTPAFGTTPPRTESFSSAGPDYIYFDKAGNRLATPEIRQVDIVGVDGGETTFFGTKTTAGVGTGPNMYPQFFGTSAAAPSAAAVAALMLQKNPNLTPDEIQNILQTTATPTVNSSGNADPATTGFGLVNATAALAAVQAPCFTTGTRIRIVRDGTETDVAVEALRVGDRAVTMSGAPRSITWIGQRQLGGVGRSLPHDQQPVRVLSNTFGAGVPARSLRLSPGHPVLVGADAAGEGGVLVPIMCLINGTSIRRETTATDVTYWHVELDSHDILLAEGLAAESYYDMGSRVWFAGADGVLLDPDFVPAGEHGRCRPVAIEGAAVEAERLRLDAVFAAEVASHAAWGEADTAWLGD